MNLKYEYFDFKGFDPLFFKYENPDYNDLSIDQLFNLWNSDTSKFTNYKINITHFLCFNADLGEESVENLIKIYEKLGNNAKKIININYKEFSYDDYISIYPDINTLSYGEAYKHWIEYGHKEERICKKKICNFNLNIVVVLHLFHKQLYIEMKEYINDVTKVFSNVKVIITLNEDCKDELLDFGFPVEFIYVPNKGVDVYPFMKCIKYIKKHNIPCDYILKLHTKKSAILGLPNWRNSLIYPLTNYSHLRILQTYMELCKDKIGVISSQECICNKDYDEKWDFLVNSIYNFLELFPQLPRDYDSFNGGNMFWINYDLIEEYMTDDIIKYISNECSDGLPKENNSIEYVCERLFTGILPYKRLNLLVNNFYISGYKSNYKLDQRVFSIDGGYLNQYLDYID
jgi:hypothetical protein